MTEKLPQWALDRARDWLGRRDNWGYPVACPHDEPPVGPQLGCHVCLATLLVEVEDRCVEDFTSEEPCKECGHGVSRDCYGCKLKAALADNEALRSTIKRVHGALTDAGSVVVPGTLEGDLAPAIRQLTRERDEARESRIRAQREAKK